MTRTFHRFIWQLFTYNCDGAYENKNSIQSTDKGGGYGRDRAVIKTITTTSLLNHNNDIQVQLPAKINVLFKECLWAWIKWDFKIDGFTEGWRQSSNTDASSLSVGLNGDGRLHGLKESLASSLSHYPAWQWLQRRLMHGRQNTHTHTGWKRNNSATPRVIWLNDMDAFTAMKPSRDDHSTCIS